MTIKICSALLLFACLCGCGPSTKGEGHLQLQLPKPLREISGLTLMPDGTLLAVADEKAHIFRINMQARLVEKLTKFGDPVKKGDFEGISLTGEHLYLVTSDGVLWRKALQADAKDYTKLKTGIGELCEVEGLTAWESRQLLLVLCKQGRHRSTRGKLTIYGWSIPEQIPLAEPIVQLDYRAAGLPELHPSGISFSADGERLFIVAAKQQSFIELNLDGSVVRGGRFPFPATHPQTEGVVITAGNTLYLADEGGKDRGRVTQYDPSF